MERTGRGPTTYWEHVQITQLEGSNEGGPPSLPRPSNTESVLLGGICRTIRINMLIRGVEFGKLFAYNEIDRD